jgi:hypothetical protein
MDIEEVFARYLAGRLPAGESEAFEEYVAGHPEICKDLEQTLRLKEGLARLRERGELTALLGAHGPRRWFPYAAAAAVLLTLLASILWLQRRSAAPGALFLSPSAIAAIHHQPSPVVGSYVLARTRGPTAVTVTAVQLPDPTGAVELRVLPSDVSPGVRYTASLKRLDGRDGTGRSQIEGASTGADGYVKVYLDGSELTTGKYEVSLRPAVPAGTHEDADRFVIQVHSH